MQAFNPPDDLLSKSQGSTQILPNGNALVNWGSEGALTEFKSDGTPIFHAYVDSGFLGIGVENYRGFRYNWTGIPHEAPAIVALKDPESASTSIYVSWNGDTQTKTWRFYEVSDNGWHSYLGESKRESFETELKLDGDEVKIVQAEALDVEGAVLVTTSGMKPGIAVEQYKGKSWEKTKGEARTGVVAWLMFEGQKFFRSQDL